MVRYHDRLQWEELADNGIVPWILPVDSAQNIRATYGISEETEFPKYAASCREYSRHPNCHGGRCHAIKNILDELVAGLHLCARLVVWYLIRNDAL